MDIEAERTEMLRGLLWNYLDLRSDVLCNLNTRDGEWMIDGYDDLAARIRLMGAMMEQAMQVALSITGSDNRQLLVRELLSDVAKERGYPVAVNWDAA